jgi:hypothetical protein
VVYEVISLNRSSPKAPPETSKININIIIRLPSSSSFRRNVMLNCHPVHDGLQQQ